MSKCNYCKEEHKDENTGCQNSGYRNSGWFNTNEPKMRFFNKECDMTYSEFDEKYSFVYPDLKICSWVELKDLPEEEQTASAKQRGGILKTLSYKDAWKEYWSRASASDKEWFQKLPNFDATIFEEITGIKVGEQSLSGQTVEVKIGDKTYKAVIQ